MQVIVKSLTGDVFEASAIFVSDLRELVAEELNVSFDKVNMLYKGIELHDQINVGNLLTRHPQLSQTLLFIDNDDRVIINSKAENLDTKLKDVLLPESTVHVTLKLGGPRDVTPKKQSDEIDLKLKMYRSTATFRVEKSVPITDLIAYARLHLDKAITPVLLENKLD